MICLKAYAKLNLTLNVTGKNEAGYHLLSSVVSFCEFGDDITISPAQKFCLEIDGPFKDSIQADDKNLVTVAAIRLCEKLGKPSNFKIKLTKNIPVAAGLGGGSADAAATVKGLCLMWDISSQNMDWLPEFLLNLGADVPMCFHGKSCRVEGIGNIILNDIEIPPYYILLVNPNKECPTAAIFENFQPGDVKEKSEEYNSLLDQISGEGNDLTTAAIELVPEISQIMDAFKSIMPCLYAGMSGSGATCYGIFENAHDIEKARAIFAKTFPDFWVQKTRLLQH